VGSTLARTTTYIFKSKGFIFGCLQQHTKNFDNELLEDFLKLSKISKNSNKELKKVKQEKESLIIILSESHVTP
jgi:hypothetical protein